MLPVAGEGSDVTKIALDGGPTLHYLLEGAPTAPAVVFVNGLTMDTTAWRPVAEHLPDLPLLRYDCRGQGQSDKPDGPYTPERHADDLLALLEHLREPRVRLVGLSNGGLVALLAAARLGPERVTSVALVDSFARVDAMLALILRGWRAALDAGGPALRFDVATPWVWGHAFLDEHHEEVLAFRERAAAADPAPVRHLIEGLLAFHGSDAGLRALRAFHGPLLALVGADDVLTPARYSRECAAAAPDGRFEELPGAGHAAPIERPVALAEALRRFWRDADAAPGAPDRSADGPPEDTDPDPAGGVR